MDFRAKLAAMAVKYNIKLSDKQLEEMTCYYEILKASLRSSAAKKCLMQPQKFPQGVGNWLKL